MSSSEADGPALTAAEIAAKIGAPPATKVGGVRHHAHATHPHHDKTSEQTEADEQKAKDKQDHDALALSNQIAEIDSLQTGSVQHELLKGSSKASPATYNPTPHPHELNDKHNIRGEATRQNRALMQPDGKNVRKQLINIHTTPPHTHVYDRLILSFDSSALFLLTVLCFCYDMIAALRVLLIGSQQLRSLNSEKPEG